MRTKLQGRKCTLGCVCSCSGSEEGGSCDNKYIYFEEGGGTWKSIISKDNNDSYSECVGCGPCVHCSELCMTQCQIVCTMRFQRVSKILTPRRMLQKT